MSDQALIVEFRYGQETLVRLFELEEMLEEVFAHSDVGEYDGHDIAMDLSDGTLYFYGPDAEAIFVATRPILESVDYLRGAVARLRFGPAEDGVPERVVTLDPQANAASRSSHQEEA